MKKIVISGVNLRDGGTLKVLQDCLAAASQFLPPEWEITAIVSDARLFDAPKVKFMAFPDAKKSWFRRINYEWRRFNDISRSIKPEIWLSMHDITPRVSAGSQYVYCHNPAPFYRISASEAWFHPKFFAFNLFYGLLYRANISANRAVIVQQDWLRKEFEERFGVKTAIVAYPQAAPAVAGPADPTRAITNFFYPSLPRPFKNFELVCDAARLLAADPRWRGQVSITIAGDENRYARWLQRRYKNVPGLHFIGLQTRDEMAARYAEADCLLFASRLETWGLPISEAKAIGLPMIVADRTYAHETVGSYARVRFTPDDDPRALAREMLDAHLGGWRSAPVVQPEPAEPLARNWKELLDWLVECHERGAAPA